MLRRLLEEMCVSNDHLVSGVGTPYSFGNSVYLAAKDWRISWRTSDTLARTRQWSIVRAD
jgi:hypothetical protein